MKLFREAIHTAQNAKTSELRKFGFIFGGLLIGLFYVLIPWLRHGHLGNALFLTFGLVLIAFAVVLPRLLRPVLLLASIVGAALGAVNNRILLAVMFFCILLPLSILMRIFSKVDNLAQKLEPESNSYLVPCHGRDLVKNKEKAF